MATSGTHATESSLIQLPAANKNEKSPEKAEVISNQPAFQWSKLGLSFWMIVIANLTCDFLSAFDMTAISTALPTIVQDLGGQDFIWAGSAYSLAGTAVIPMCGSLVPVFGRKPILLLCVAFFAVGSALAGATQSMNMLIAARAIQGFGSGGCLAVTEIIYADLVPLPQRGIIQGITAVVWAFASAIGPLVGGALASAGAWRWLFYLNLPITAAAACLELLFLPNNAPQAAFMVKMRRLDWVGSAVVVGGSASFILALTWGGQRFPWQSAQVLVPLVVGAVALCAFLFIEKFLVTEPIIPWSIVTNRTSFSGYLGTAVHGIASFATLYYLPVYFQAVKGASPIRSGVELLGLTMFVTPAAMVCGATVQICRVYRPQNYLGWALTIAGFGILSILDVSSSKAQYICCQIVIGIGLGIVWISTQFPILAPLPFSNNAQALAFFTFVRSFSQTLGVAIGGTILQNSLQHKLPPSFLSSLPSGVSVAYSSIPVIQSLPKPIQTQVRIAFSDSMKVLWYTMIGISGVGLATVLLMKEVPMRTDVDEQWGLENQTQGVDGSADQSTVQV
ncbi:iron permease [Trametopsis cervina]|nr:iron permease [Trametopsis cervina]